jgi:hypothetical protein
MHWEYRIVKIPATGGFLGGKFDEASLDARLNELGATGWEAISAFVTHLGYGQSRDVVVVLKRSKG